MTAHPPNDPDRPGVPARTEDDLRTRIVRYLRDHHTMTVATTGPPPASPPAPDHRPVGHIASAGAEAGPAPHAASVFYAVDDALRLVFLSKATSLHGLHIGAAAPVAVTVTEQYDDWEVIQGVQLWGTARRVTGTARAAAMAVYLRRFPFVAEVMRRPRLAATMRKVAVYRVEPERIAFTDNTTGVFGREILALKG